MTGEQIKAIRKEMGMTQMEFSRVMQVSFATCNRWERGHCKPLPDRLFRLKLMKERKHD